MPKVYNLRRKDAPEGAVYIGRPTRWGNPFEIGRDGTRAEVVQKFRDLIATDTALRTAAKEELRGQDLECWCAPLACHGDILLEIANAETTE